MLNKEWRIKEAVIKLEDSGQINRVMVSFDAERRKTKSK
jgi:hypothetical protein